MSGGVQTKNDICKEDDLDNEHIHQFVLKLCFTQVKGRGGYDKRTTCVSYKV